MAEELVRQSILDRLIGADRLRTGGSREGRPPRSWHESVTLLERNVLRDVEALLNSRQIDRPAAPPHLLLSRSIFNFGLVDITSLSADSEDTAQEIRQLIKETIQRFEPRLVDVDVVQPEDDEGGDSSPSRARSVRFRVEATLRTEPEPEHVEFETILELSSKRFEVSKELHV